jgi:CHAD domain-containing protein
MKQSSHEILSYLQERTQNINRFLGRSLRYFAEDDIHELRVEIKRIRACIQLMAWMAVDFKSKRALKPIRKVFKAAGRLRDLHVQRQLLWSHLGESARELGEFQNELTARETEARIDYGQVASRFDTAWFERISAAAEEALLPLSVDDATWRIGQRLAVSISRLADLQDESNLPDAELHRVRILCKEARYTLEILRPNAPSDQADYYEQLDHHLRQVHRALGRWHDADVGLDVLSRFLEREARLPLTSPESYRLFAEQLANIRDRHLGEFQPRWETLQRLLRQGTSSSAT